MDVVDGNEEALEKRIETLVEMLASQTPSQPQALGKWAYWTQVGFTGSGSQGPEGGDGYESAVDWAGRVMALHARSEDAKEGMHAFIEKRKPEWKTNSRL